MYIQNRRDGSKFKGCNPLKLHSGLTGNYNAICHYSYNLPLPPSVKKQKTIEQFATKRQKRINQIMNSLRTKQHICKPHNPTQNQSLQKSCFLADAL